MVDLIFRDNYPNYQFGLFFRQARFSYYIAFSNSFTEFSSPVLKTPSSFSGKPWTIPLWYFCRDSLIFLVRLFGNPISMGSPVYAKITSSFTDRKIFYSDSERIFWAEGTSLSADGQKALALMGLFLKRIEGRVVVSENGLDAGSRSEELGLARALAVVEYLTGQAGLDEGRFSISAASTMDSSTRLPRKGKRALEIVILERSIYN